MRGSGDLDVMLILGGADQIESLHQQQPTHQEMDPVHGPLVGVEDVDPETQEDDVGEEEEEEEGRELGEAGGEEVLGVVGLEVEDLGADVHGDGGLGGAVGEEEAVLVGGGDGVGLAEGGGGRGRELPESEEPLDVAGLEDAELGVLLHLEEDLEQGLLREEEEPQARWLDVVGGVGSGLDGDVLDGDVDVAPVGEPELLEEDHGAGVGGDG
ncbi:hypothetical protein TorRG33x02_014330 [Trema orientale]|uniref:Uncharacterized protein n=1 Tax=Trema orientale TaxID=63057 RepID=A0A2P5FXE0_TREOI|nr:hypothetical protein TorRG33x02_014330 [Trema orientale]